MILAQQIEAASAIAPFLFYPFAALTVIGALCVVFSQQIVRTAVALLCTLSGVAFLYFFLEAEFLAAIQLIVYVGGTLILIIFGVMLTNKNPFVNLTVSITERVIGYFIGLLVMVMMGVLGLFFVLPFAGRAASPAETFDYGLRDLGMSLLGKYALPFELAGVLLLVVMIGAAFIAKGRHDTDHTGGAA